MKTACWRWPQRVKGLYAKHDDLCDCHGCARRYRRLCFVLQLNPDAEENLMRVYPAYLSAEKKESWWVPGEPEDASWD